MRAVFTIHFCILCNFLNRVLFPEHFNLRNLFTLVFGLISNSLSTNPLTSKAIGRVDIVVVSPNDEALLYMKAKLEECLHPERKWEHLFRVEYVKATLEQFVGSAMNRQFDYIEYYQGIDQYARHLPLLKNVCVTSDILHFEHI